MEKLVTKTFFLKLSEAYTSKKIAHNTLLSRFDQDTKKNGEAAYEFPLGCTCINYHSI